VTRNATWASRAWVGQAAIQLQHPLLAGGYFLMLGDTGASIFCYRDLTGFHRSYTEHASSEAALSELAPESCCAAL
jgi:hypothetical protein